MHAHHHGERGDMAERARECERGGHLLHRRHPSTKLSFESPVGKSLRPSGGHGQADWLIRLMRPIVAGTTRQGGIPRGLVFSRPVRGSESSGPESTGYHFADN